MPHSNDGSLMTKCMVHSLGVEGKWNKTHQHDRRVEDVKQNWLFVHNVSKSPFGQSFIQSLFLHIRDSNHSGIRNW